MISHGRTSLRILAAAAGLATLVIATSASAFPWAHMPEITRHNGPTDGLMVMWPRIVPPSDNAEVDAVALALHGRLTGVAQRIMTVPELLMVRPEPERSCRVGGCKATTLGVLLAHREGGCAAVALVTPPGQSPTTLVPWGGEVAVSQTVVPFRTPPETAVAVVDFVACNDLTTLLADGAVDLALRDALAQAAGNVSPTE